MSAKDPTDSMHNPGDYSDLPVRAPPPGYGATAEDIARGHLRIENVDVEGRIGLDRSRVPTIPPVRE